MSSIATPEHKKVAGQLKNVLATYAEAEDLVNIGAYRAGSNPSIDFALSKIDAANDFLMQDMYEKIDFDETVARLEALFEQQEEEA
jgi:flagellum-specific ATP synthase